MPWPFTDSPDTPQRVQEPARFRPADWPTRPAQGGPDKAQLKASLVKHKLVKPTSNAPLHILREIASGIFIDGEPL